MNEQKFLNVFENAVMVDEGTLFLETKLETLEDWDSLAIATLLSELEEIVGFEVDVAEISECQSIQEVYNEIDSQLKKNG